MKKLSRFVINDNFLSFKRAKIAPLEPNLKEMLNKFQNVAWRIKMPLLTRNVMF